MGKLFKALGILLVLVIAAGAAIHFTGNSFNAMVWVLKPKHDFGPEHQAPAPDYKNLINWAAHPELDDPADLTPEGLFAPETVPQIDVFFLHPTGYMHSGDWNSPMDPASSTAENTAWMMANQASVFNGCCRIYAPRYRQASIMSYFNGDLTILGQALGLAYEDVERAFDEFLEEIGDRPFILAGHSQGTGHALTLLKTRISSTELRDRMVAAYILGGDVTHERLAELPDIEPCNTANQLHCVNHWATYGEGGEDMGWTTGQTVCTNPLSWEDGGDTKDGSHHKGAALPTGDFSLKMYGADEAQGLNFTNHEAPLAGVTYARCENGMLIVKDLSEGPLSWGTAFPGKYYHLHDFHLFYVDLWQNAILRSETFLAQRAGAEADQPAE